MRIRSLILTITAASLTVLSPAQTKVPQRTSAQGDTVVSRQLGSPSAKAIKSKMAQIRKTRPTVGLVLSGGGAKGAAHIGVIRRLEELGIPVDLVAGTSMGGLIGGLYALGYSSDEMDAVISSMDWDKTLSDRLDREYMYYSDKTYRDRYMISAPFYYRGKKVNLESIGGSLVGNRFSGFAFGQNVGNTLSSLSVGYQDSLLFANLPVPYTCVATDMVSGRAKIWTEGKMVTAMRSTMSIPGLFAPVTTDDRMVLTDGGMRNNYPVDIARSLGADIIIGVTLADGYADFEGLQNIGGLAMQSIDMLGREAYERNQDKADITIRPDITGYNMLSFSSDAITELINRGYQAADASSADLMSLKHILGRRVSVPKRSHAVNLAGHKVRIDSVAISGVDRRDERYLRGLVKRELRDTMDAADIENIVSTLYGTRAFDVISYELLGSKEPYHLSLRMKPGPIHRLGLGVRFDTEELMSALVNVGLGTGRFRGAALDFESKIGTNPYVGLRCYLHSSSGFALNLTGRYRYVDRNQLSVGDSHYRAVFHEVRTEAYISRYKMRDFDFKLGARDEFFNIAQVMSDKEFKSFDEDMDKSHYPAAFASLRWDRLDDGIFPTRGYRESLDAAFVLDGFDSFTPAVAYLQYSLQRPWTPFRFFTLVPYLNVRLAYGENVPYVYANMVGGTMAGRYLDQQIPFIGTTHCVLTRSAVAVARADLRFRISSSHYFSILGNAMAEGDFPFLHTVDAPASLHYGFGVKYDYATIAGPVSLVVGWSDITQKVAVTLSAGFDF